MRDWFVQVKGERCSEEFEITVCRKSNAHGQRSWGWIDENKLLISHNGGPCQDALIPAVWDRMIKLAEEVCAELNNAEHPFPIGSFVRNKKRGVGYVVYNKGYGEGRILGCFGGGCGGVKSHSASVEHTTRISYAEFLACARRKGHTQLISQAPKQ